MFVINFFFFLFMLKCWLLTFFCHHAAVKIFDPLLTRRGRKFIKTPSHTFNTAEKEWYKTRTKVRVGIPKIRKDHLIEKTGEVYVFYQFSNAISLSQHMKI